MVVLELLAFTGIGWFLAGEDGAIVGFGLWLVVAVIYIILWVINGDAEYREHRRRIADALNFRSPRTSPTPAANAETASDNGLVRVGNPEGSGPPERLTRRVRESPSG